MSKNMIIENKAEITTSIFAWWRPDVAHEVSFLYWRDVHGVLASRMEGTYQYRQLHLGYIDPEKLYNVEGIEGVELDLPLHDQPNGIAQLLYLSAKDLEAFIECDVTVKYVSKDEPYLVSRNAFTMSVTPETRTFIDRNCSGLLNGASKNPRYAIAFKKQEGASVDEFRKYLTEFFAEKWSKLGDVQRLRLHLLESYEESPSTFASVSHTWDKSKQYQAWIEVELSKDFLISSLFQQSVDLKKYISAIHAYPVEAVYTFVYDGKPTLVGLRGYHAAEAIQAAGAENQKSEDLLEELYGKIIHSTNSK
ncbi:hypothetical protein BIZ37_18455 [Photobacterium sp. BZF1]|uniref:hypothetical protein n=1 Tax=Photobacterium sp. BZF1 TaxID=1904457 RepID=UPI001653DDB6|nr:hypothetical protein [Photobacterium sp. BZF1]MBC7004547.1 hypothetical protein [Photobacterium sp. BZF1]